MDIFEITIRIKMTVKLLTVSALFLALSCTPKTNYEGFGEPIDPKTAISIQSLNSLSVESETSIKLTGTVNEVCQAKGCWMTLTNENGAPIRVTFKDYGFFVPKDIAGSKVIVNGLLTKAELDPEMAKHYAEDANTTYDSTKSYLEYSLVADGVLVAMTSTKD
jgi:hypothetical protein